MAPDRMELAVKTTSQMRAIKLPKRCVFIAHYVESWNWLLNFRLFGFLHERPRLRWLLWPLYPICFLASVWYLFGKKSFNVVDDYKIGKELECQTILIRNFAWHFLFMSRHEAIKARILEAALYAQNTLKADVVGLGALTKAEWLTAGGKWLAENEAIKVPVVHGDTCTAWFVARQIEDLYARFKRTGPTAVIGPTSKIGRAVMLHLIKRGYGFIAYTKDPDRFRAIWEEVPADLREHLRRAENLSELSQCNFWLIGKAVPTGRVLARSIPRGAVTLNFSVPDPLTPWCLDRHRDIRHFDGGLTTLPKECGLKFAMRLTVDKNGRGVTYACNAGTIIHTALAWQEHEVGEVKLDELAQVGQEAKRLGIGLPPYSSHLIPVNYLPKL